MITNITEDRLVVVSDVHLGNRLFNLRRPFIEFLEYVRKNRYNVCINGDGVDIVQTTLGGLARDLSECSGELRRFARDGLRVYYTVGNHDIVLEHFLDDWDIVRVAPFLNLQSGESRIRIEHGHIYDDAYVTFPRLYQLATLLGGLALKIHPSLYTVLERGRHLGNNIASAAHLKAAMKPAGDDGDRIPNEALTYRDRACEVSRHGFDTVIFGHTHCCGQARLETGATYINTGSWFCEPHYAEIDHGRVTLKRVADCGSEIAAMVMAYSLPTAAV